MKENIHPKSEEVTITCTCGGQFKTTSTLGKNFTVELCSKCHPFFTGKQRLVDSTGRVERFQKRFKKYQDQNKKKEDKKAKSTAETTTENQ
ncbi:MAG: 50S ribosomal protein L31 [Pseudomonadota bacterium]